MAYPLRPIIYTSATLSLLEESHGNGCWVIVKRAAGCTVTLPAATGSGASYQVMVGTTISSNSFIIQVANSSDTMVGNLETASTTGATTNGFSEALGGTDDTITMNGTTTGGIAGSFVTLVDIDVNLWLVSGALVGSGTLATSVSAAV